jgi:hypothetical protein
VLARTDGVREHDGVDTDGTPEDLGHPELRVRRADARVTARRKFDAPLEQWRESRTPQVSAGCGRSRTDLRRLNQGVHWTVPCANSCRSTPGTEGLAAHSRMTPRRVGS